MIIADTNLLSYLYFDSIYSEEANMVHVKDSEWAFPILWRSEFVNVVALYLRKNIITYKQGLDAIDFAKRAVGEREFSVSQYSVLELANESKCTAYDAEYVALAEEFNIPLITYDKKILKEFPSIAISASDFLKR
jgi:predicted nucleic acid-binding protein